MIKRAVLGLCAAALLTSPVLAAEVDPALTEALQAIEDAMPGTLINNPFAIEYNVQGGDASGKIVTGDDMPNGSAYQIKVKKKKKNSWDTATRIPMTSDVNKDDSVLVSFWARAAKPPKGYDTGKITVALQRTIDPYDSVVQEDIDLGTEWKLYTIGGTAARDYPADKGTLNFNLAHAKQTVELGTFYIMSLGPNADVAKYIDK